MPYVIKANHDSGSVFFVRNESARDWEWIEKLCADWLRSAFPQHLHEKWYHLTTPQILVEPLGENLLDFKFYVFEGRVQYIHVDTDRFIGHKRRFYDRNWNPLPFSLKFPLETRSIQKPTHLEEMINGAERLGTGLDFVRVDFYDLPQGARFGYEPFDPPEYDRIVGEYWNLKTGSVSR